MKEGSLGMKGGVHGHEGGSLGMKGGSMGMKGGSMGMKGGSMGMSPPLNPGRRMKTGASGGRNLQLGRAAERRMRPVTSLPTSVMEAGMGGLIRMTDVLLSSLKRL